MIHDEQLVMLLKLLYDSSLRFRNFSNVMISIDPLKDDKIINKTKGWRQR